MIEPDKMTDDPADVGSLRGVAVRAVIGVGLLLLASFGAATIWERNRPDAYVVDYYPPSPVRSARLVFRWPSRGLQMPPVVLERLPSSVSDQWGGNQPKRATLGPTTILPAGRVIEADTTNPPGRYVLAIGRQRVTVSPESDWSVGRPAARGNEEPRMPSKGDRS